MHREAIDLFRMLVEAGAIPGEDFSCDANQGGYRLTQRSLDLLAAAYPSIDWSDLTAEPIAEPHPQIIQELHKELATPFVDALLWRMKDRLNCLGETQGAWYLNQILVGVQQRTGLKLLPLLTQAVGLAGQVRLEWLLRLNHLEPCDYWIYDLVMAAGGSETDVAWDEFGVYLTERGLSLLEKVWIGDYETHPLYYKRIK
jgi:hypothetical protein